jgi:hypothetical protein
MIGSKWPDDAVCTGIARFYDAKMAKILSVALDDLIATLNPYECAALYGDSRLVRWVLQGHIWGSTHTMFGQRVVQYVAQSAPDCFPIPRSGMDFFRRVSGAIEGYSMKSGIHQLNSTEWAGQESHLKDWLKKQNTAFDGLKRLPIVAFAYGRHMDQTHSLGNKGGTYRVLAGQAFWEHLSGDPDAYLKIVRLIGKEAKAFRMKFQEAYEEKENRLVREFEDRFCNGAEGLDTEKLTRAVSSPGSRTNNQRTFREENGAAASTPTD